MKCKVITIWGPEQGGKSTLAVNLASMLADSGNITCLVCCADHAVVQSYFRISKHTSPDTGTYAAISNGRNVREALISPSENLFILEPYIGGDSYQVANMEPEQVTTIISELRDQFSYVIIDGNNHKGAFNDYSLSLADEILLLVPHTAQALTWLHGNRQMLDKLKTKTRCVDSNIHNDEGLNAEMIMNENGLEPASLVIPTVSSAFHYMCQGTPIIFKAGREERKYRKALVKLVESLMQGIPQSTAQTPPDDLDGQEAE